MTDQKNQTKNSQKGFSSRPARPLKFWHDPSHNQEVHIELVPLMDVIFCILTFFILGAVGLSRQQAIGLDLPKAQTGTPQMREMLVVSLDNLGQLYVEQQLVTPNQLYQAIQNYHQFNPSGLMVLHAARNASYSEVVQVLDMLRQVGGDRVALATLPGESNPLDSWNSYPGSNTSPLGTGLPGSSFNPLPQSLPTNPNPAVGNPNLNPSNSVIPNAPNPANSPSGNLNPDRPSTAPPSGNLNLSVPDNNRAN